MNTYRDRDGSLLPCEPPTYADGDALARRASEPHAWAPDDNGLSCAVCELPRTHGRHQSNRSGTSGLVATKGTS